MLNFCTDRRSIPIVAKSLLASLFLLPTISFAQDSAIPERLSEFSARKYTPSEIETMDAPSANPWLSIPGVDMKTDWNYWRMKRSMESNSGAGFSSQATAKIVQPLSGLFPYTFLPKFGTLPWQDSSVEITGEFELPEPTLLIPFPEDEGSISLATETDLVAGNAVVVDSEIGDGLFGESGTGSGDIDFYVVRNVVAGQTITVDLDTPVPFGPLDPYVEIYDSNGVFLAANDDGDPSSSYDSFLTFTAPDDGDYFISIAGFGTFFLADPFDSSSGLGNIFGLPLDEGIYTATIGLDYVDEQEFVFLLKKGDVFGAAIEGAGSKLSIIDGTKTERQGSMQDLRFIMPDNSPLPAGDISVNHVADRFGFFKLTAEGRSNGPFSLRLEAALPTLKTGILGDVQTIFIDFDGATVDLSESLFPELPPGDAVVTLSPLSAFLSGWGISDADEYALVDKIMSVINKSLVLDIKERGGNPFFKIELLNSRDHQDPFGLENVSRVIVGGTIDELGVSTIGIAQSIDVGNFDTSETAFVLLDLLSDPNPFNPNSLNSFPIDPSASIIDLVGIAVGEITAHEAGHYLGNWHTDQFNDQPNIMDQGGNLAFSIIGLGPDGIYGTGDDVDVGFGRDTYVPSEGLTGIENTMTSIAWGATLPNSFFPFYLGEENVVETPPADF